MLQEKLRALEASRELLADGLLDNPRTCKADQSARLRQNNIPQHGKTRRYPAGRGIRQHVDREKAGIAVAAKGRSRFCHLHEGGHSLLHPGPAGANKKDHRQAVFCCPFHRSGDLFSHHFPHARHEKAAVADAENRRKPVDPAFSCEYGLVKAGLFPKIRDLIGIASITQGIFFIEIGVPLLKTPLIQHLLDPAAGMHPEIGAAPRADIQILSGLLHKNR